MGVVVLDGLVDLLQVVELTHKNRKMTTEGQRV